MPKELEKLMEVARIKQLARKASVTKIMQKPNTVVFTFEPATFRMELVDHLVNKYRNQIRFSPAKDPYITLKIENLSENKVIEAIKSFLKDVA